MREARLTVANYEKRPEPLTFQQPFGLEGSMECTQVAPDLRLVLFSAEPDIAHQRQPPPGGPRRSLFDAVRLTELSLGNHATPVVAGDAARGEYLLRKHPAACVLCHALGGQGSAAGPALDDLARRAAPAYIRESLLEPSKVMAKGFERYTVSPMLPMADIFSAQELSDLEAFLLTLK